MKILTCFLNENISRDDLFIKISELVSQNKIVKNKIVNGLIKRENEITTGLGDKIAIPHFSLEELKEPLVIFIKNKMGIEWYSLDNQKVNLIFCILTSKDNQTSHLEILSNISKILLNDSLKTKLFNSENESEVNKILLSKNKEEQIEYEEYDIVAVTACPSGLAHTFLAKDSLINEAKKRNLTIKVETHGANGVEDKLSDKEIKNAKQVILAVDTQLDLSRYKNKNVYKTRTIDVVKNPQKCFENKKNNLFKKFYNEFYISTTSSTKYLFFSIKILGFILGILYLLKNTLSNNEDMFFSNWNMIISLIGKLILFIFTGLITYNISKKDEGLIIAFITSIIFGLSITNKTINIESIGLIDILIISIGWHILILAVDKLLHRIKFEYLFIKSLSKFVLYLIGISIFILIKIFIWKYLNYIHIESMNWILNVSNKYWWFNTITIFVLANLYIIDFGRDINKWTMILCYLIYTISISFNVNNLWLYPFTVILFAPAIPNFNSSLSLFISKNKYTEKELKIAKKTFKDGFRPITESTIPLYKIFKYKLLIANFMSVLCGSILIGIFELKFFGGISSPLGFIFGYVNSKYWFYGLAWLLMYISSISVGVITLTSLNRIKGDKKYVIQ